MAITRVIAVMLASLFATALEAGDQYVDQTGYAVSGYDVVAYFDLPQSHIGQQQVQAVPGKSALTADYNGAKFAFSTKHNLTRFLTDPTKYAPQFDGHCAYSVAEGRKVPGNPDLWRIVDGKLYLNVTPDIAQKWEQNISGYLADAGGNWNNSMEQQSASNDPVPHFTPRGPLAN